jgi:hypothetical protein
VTVQGSRERAEGAGETTREIGRLLTIGLASRNHHRVLSHLIFPVNGTSALAPHINIEEEGTIEAVNGLG